MASPVVYLLGFLVTLPQFQPFSSLCWAPPEEHSYVSTLALSCGLSSRLLPFSSSCTVCSTSTRRRFFWTPCLSPPRIQPAFLLLRLVNYPQIQPFVFLYAMSYQRILLEFLLSSHCVVLYQKILLSTLALSCGLSSGLLPFSSSCTVCSTSTRRFFWTPCLSPPRIQPAFLLLLC